MNSSPLNNFTRRHVLKTGLAGVGALSSMALGIESASNDKKTPPRKEGSIYMGDFAAPKIKNVRMAFIGLGQRGRSLCTGSAGIEGLDIVALCDLSEDKCKSTETAVNRDNHEPKLYYGSPDAYEKMLKEIQPDAVIIATPWELHHPMTIASLKAGVHTFMEVAMAITMAEMWDIVDTCEATQKHCMMMENVNYGYKELAFLNIVRQGLLGDLLHGEAAYIHDLRYQMKDVIGTGTWRSPIYQVDGNLYPTHGLGPVAQYMNIARGDDMFARLVSFSSPSKGRNQYAKKHLPADHKWNKMDFKGGDINTSIIKTDLGRTIMVQWDETTPRPYSRLNLIQGTQGTLAGFPLRMHIEGVTPDAHHWPSEKELEKLIKKYEHPLWTKMGTVARKVGGHGGMDFMMMYRIVQCLREGVPLDQNVYEGAFWSAVGPLSIASVAAGGMPQIFPDFTRGDWKKTKPVGICS